MKKLRKLELLMQSVVELSRNDINQLVGGGTTTTRQQVGDKKSCISMCGLDCCNYGVVEEEVGG